MRRYGKWAPTGFDQPGAFLEDQHDWFVVPVSQTRDSGPLDRSNFETAQTILQDGREEADDFEVHRFGHWGPGWVEIIIVKPDSRAFELAEDIEAQMERYPVLDDEDFCEREYDEFCRSWDSWACDEFVEALSKEFELSERAAEFLGDADKDALRSWWMDHARDPYEGDHIPINRAGDWFDRSDVAGLLRQLRKAPAVA